MRRRVLPVLIVLLSAFAVPLAWAATSVPFDEETLGRIDALNRAITDHYEELRGRTVEIEARREVVKTQLDSVQRELTRIEAERAKVERSQEVRGPALRVMEEHRIEAKSRYLEALAEKHAIDLEATEAFEVHATAILTNLERLADALERSGRIDASADPEVARDSLHSLQQGTAIALSVLEEWGALSRDDPRFRALWATSRVLNRNVQRLGASHGIQTTVDLVRERTFVVRSLVDQARALRAALDHQGLLLQVAAQNQMLRLHFTRLGAINGLELPDLDLEDSARRILEDIEEEPFVVDSDDPGDPLGGFDDCVHHGDCR